MCTTRLATARWFSPTLDFSQSVAILLITVLYFIPDAGQAYDIVAKLLDAVVPGSFPVILHAPSDIRSDEVAEMARRYNASAPITPRTRDQVVRFFDGLEMIGPGLVNLTEWHESGDADSNLAGYVGIGKRRDVF